MGGVAIQAPPRRANGLLPKDLVLLRGACEAVFLLDADLSIRWVNSPALALAGSIRPRSLSRVR